MLRRLLKPFSATPRTEPGREGVRFAGVLRVLCLSALVSFAFTAFTARSVYGEMQETALRVGRDMLKLKDVLGPPQKLVFNGATLYAGGRHLPISVKEFLDRFEQHCEERSAGFEEDFRLIPPEKLRLLPEEWRRPQSLGVMRKEAGDKEGVLSCIVHPEGAKGVRDLITRIGAFMETGDASQIGHLRFVFAKKNEERGGCDVVTVWNDGPFNIDQILATDGDAPGRDTEGAPRPPGTRRVMSAEVEGVSHAYRAYESADSSESLLDFYDKNMQSWGWEAVDGPADDEGLLRHQRAFLKDNAVLFIEAEREGATTKLQVVEMGSRGALQVEVGPR
jgi:hypothetical protein